jgi:hypothetical protein
MVYNLAGQMVLKSENLSGESHLNTTRLPAGEYTCQLSQNGTVYTQKFVVTH